MNRTKSSILETRHLFNIIEIFKKFQIFDYHRFQNFTIKKTCFLKSTLSSNFWIQCSKLEKNNKIIKRIFWWYLNKYYSMIFIRCYYKSSVFMGRNCHFFVDPFPSFCQVFPIGHLLIFSRWLTKRYANHNFHLLMAN